VIDIQTTRIPVDGATADGTDGRSFDSRNPAAGGVWYIVTGRASVSARRRPGRQQPAGNNGMVADSKRKVR